MARKPKVSLVLCAAGGSTRLPGPHHKPFLLLQGRPMLLRALDCFRGLPGVIERIIMLHPDDLAYAKRRWGAQLAAAGATSLLAGGSTRQQTVALALKAAHPDSDLVAVHDAARPFTPMAAIRKAIEAAATTGAAIVAVPVTSTLKKVKRAMVEATVDRANLWQAQTPQVFQRAVLLRAYEAAARAGFDGTDDAQLVERLGHAVQIVTGAACNLKVTTGDDLVLARALLARRHRKRRRNCPRANT